jgi:hypothetical protein
MPLSVNGSPPFDDTVIFLKDCILEASMGGFLYGWWFTNFYSSIVNADWICRSLMLVRHRNVALYLHSPSADVSVLLNLYQFTETASSQQGIKISSMRFFLLTATAVMFIGSTVNIIGSSIFNIAQTRFLENFDYDPIPILIRWEIIGIVFSRISVSLFFIAY